MKSTTLKNTLISKKKKKIGTLINSLITVIDIAVLQLQWGTKQITKKLPLTMEVQKLKVLIHRLFDLDSSEQNFFSYNPKVL